jgi:hypothetical protein
MRCPAHVEQYVRPVFDSKRLVGYPCDERSPCYSVVCSCGGREFKIYTTRTPTVSAQCSHCGEVIVVYDVRLYPAATPSRTAGDAVLFSAAGATTFGVCVVYEYPELDGDQEFDLNDISWCEVYALGKDDEVVGRVISDETS